jgi:ribose transport system permease protein
MKMGKIRKLKSSLSLENKGILIALLVMWILFFLTNENFRNIYSYISIIREASFVGITAIGMTFCIISGNFDLSVGSMLAFLSLVTVSIAGAFGLVPMFIAIILLGFILGTLNGFFVGVLRIPAFIATLAMLFIYRAMAFIFSNGNPIQYQEKWFTNLGNGKLLGLPIPFLIFVLLTFLGTYLLRKTGFGRHTLAIGNSESASFISGINVVKTRILIFSMIGAFTGIASILISSRLWSANPGMKYGYEFEVIAAVVLGGTPLDGGRGSVVNTFIAAIFFASLNTAMNMFHVDSYMQRVVIGIVLLFAFSMSGIRDKIEELNRKKTSNRISA